MRTDELDFELPPQLIAQSPAPQRSASRLLHYRRDARSIDHATFARLPQLLRRGDLLVFNDARVVPARFMLRKESGGRVEGLFLAEPAPRRWRALLKDVGKRPEARSFYLDRAPEIGVRIIEKHEGGEFLLEVNSLKPALVLLGGIGRMPLPPYIKRQKEADPRDAADVERYQTVFARAPGAIAAPTAGLHFTDELLRELDAAGVERAFVTLHVGVGTFKPITSAILEEHQMHAETYTIDESAAAALNRAKEQGRRVVAVGTTSARVLESQPANEPFAARSAETRIFIYPPYKWKHVGAMITNFHLPRSTLIGMIAAFVGLEEQRRIYRVAIEERYRFFSYGDAMFIE